MNWLNWRVIFAVTAVLVLTVGLAVLLALPHRPINQGFGPEWQCYRTIMRGPVCFKDDPNAASPSGLNYQADPTEARPRR
jgi:hypothetical protein